VDVISTKNVRKFFVKSGWFNLPLQFGGVITISTLSERNQTTPCCYYQKNIKITFQIWRIYTKKWHYLLLWSKITIQEDILIITRWICSCTKTTACQQKCEGFKSHWIQLATKLDLTLLGESLGGVNENIDRTSSWNWDWSKTTVSTWPA